MRQRTSFAALLLLSICAAQPSLAGPPLPGRLVVSAGGPNDAFSALYELATGVECGERGPLSPDQARELHARLLGTPTTLRNFGPRLVTAYLLREVAAGEVVVSRAELLERLRRFQRLAVLRPDGYLAWAINGKTAQRAGRLEVRGGVLAAGPFVLGRFYDSAGGVFRRIDERFQPERPDWPLADVHDDADLISRTLDGVEDALVDLVRALGNLVVHPIRSAEELARLPATLALLIRESPAYYERFRLMTRGEQIRALSRMTTSLLLTVGGAASTANRLGTAAQGFGPVALETVSLAADEALVVQRVTVPVGQMATALSGGPGALYVLQMANQSAQAAQAGGTPPSGGPGRWVEAAESMSDSARRYQSQVTGAPQGQVYRVENVRMPNGDVKPKVDFDGFHDGVLLETKGPGYVNFVQGGMFKGFFTGRYGMLEQATSQLAAARGLPVRWHVAEAETAEAIRALFRGRVSGIEVVHTPFSP
ncbi:MAG TPA: Tox-REase-5 domain-containing protein [Myxococcaceae bacterium]|nr:Tox-REase-5 domain-containing protein [Myxococcaceae bacterium]